MFGFVALLNGALLALLDGDSLPLPLNACGGIGCEVAPPFLSLRCGGTYFSPVIGPILLLLLSCFDFFFKNLIKL